MTRNALHGKNSLPANGHIPSSPHDRRNQATRDLGFLDFLKNGKFQKKQTNANPTDQGAPIHEQEWTVQYQA